MRAKNNPRYFVYLLVIVLGTAVWVAVTAAADSTGLDEATIKAHLEKKVAGDTGSCLVDDMKLDIVGIADLVPDQQAEAYYTFEYKLRCNRRSETKKGQGVLKAVRLRDGKWMDRETVGVISK